MSTRPRADEHAALMDSIYRGQRHIYDATRKYFLFGRDRLIEELRLAPGQTVLEIGCGTGRNLGQIARRWPGASLHGLDISSEMLKSAGARLEDRARLARGDATGFDPVALFGRAGFDHVVLSFALSIIPEWREAVSQALRVVDRGGSLHIVDFGDLSGVPEPMRTGLRAWLAHFHVTPRLELPGRAAALGAYYSVTDRRGPLGYYRLLHLTDTRPPV